MSNATVAAATPAPAVVELEAMTKKQLAKEFKSTAKEIKSKDPAVKEAVLRKLKNQRYLLEGGCLLPLIESLAPKKVSRIMTNTGHF
jgi:hypothetical protein